jgi:hypothetical protein
MCAHGVYLVAPHRWMWTPRAPLTAKWCVALHKPIKIEAHSWLLIN